MSRNLVRPFFPEPPQGYNQRYFAELVRSFATYLIAMQNPGEGAILSRSSQTCRRTMWDWRLGLSSSRVATLR
jgi:hypothetical protein